MQANSQMREMFSVGERAQQEWFTRAEKAWATLKENAELVMHRGLRAKALTVCADVSTIIRNCQADPNDLREETAFPVMVERVASLVEEYVRSASVVSLAVPASPKLTNALRILDEAHTGFTNLLQTMQANDAHDFSLRTTAMSSVFRRLPVVEEKPPNQPG